MKNKTYLTNMFKTWRTTIGYSQDETAEILEVLLKRKITQSMVQKWEAGKRPIDMKIAIEISRYIKVGISELIERR